MRNKTVLVTGGYGFIGRHVARFYAEKGWYVIGIGHGEWSREEWKSWNFSEWHPCDITLDSLVKYAGKPDVIVHCAGSGVVGFSFEHPFQDFKRNVGTTLCVLEFARLHASHTRIVFLSSAGVYGKAEKMPISENSPLNPVSPYGVHKKVAEDLCRSYGQHFKIAACVIRLFSVYGVGLRKQLLWDACSKLSKNEITFFGTGQETRDWLHIHDVVNLLYTAAEHASPHCPTVNGGTGFGVAINEILREIIKCFGRSDNPIFTGNARQGDPVHYVADISTAQSWGWGPKIEWRFGIRDYAQWFQKGAP